MTIVEVVIGAVIAGLLSFITFQIGEMRGRAAGRDAGYEQCLGAIDSDEDARAAWRARSNVFNR